MFEVNTVKSRFRQSLPMVVTHFSAEYSSQSTKFWVELGGKGGGGVHHSHLVLVHLIYSHFAAKEREELPSGRVSLVFLKILNSRT